MDNLEKKIKELPHQRKTEDASIVVYDGDGNFVIEMYCARDGSVQVGNQRLFFEDVCK